MKMVFRWFGEGQDSIPLAYIGQIPGIYGVVTSFLDIPVGEVWPLERIKAVKENVNAHGLSMEVIESVNIHEDIKLGGGARDQYIDNYITTVKNLASAGVKCICYNFMPVFDWLRTHMAKPMPNGATAMYYDAGVLAGIKNPTELVNTVKCASQGFALPGWEPERLSEAMATIAAYQHIDGEMLFNHLAYFLKAVIPVCERFDVKMAIHPDDPPWGIFGLPRIVTSQENLIRLTKLVNSPYNGLTLCSGSLGANPSNNIPAMIRCLGDRIHFAHIRNLKYEGDGSFGEVSHFSADGSLDLYEIMKAYYDIQFTGYIRPDHGRMIWGEQGRPGYGLYDRAMGVAYLNGLLEAITKGDR